MSCEGGYPAAAPSEPSKYESLRSLHVNAPFAHVLKHSSLSSAPFLQFQLVIISYFFTTQLASKLTHPFQATSDYIFDDDDWRPGP